MKSLSLYIHIPFCIQICKYCDFASSKYKDESQIQEYVTALQKEFEGRLAGLEPIQTPSIYFGGGTPSLLKPAHLEKLFKTLNRWVNWDKKTEITLEANPQTLTDDLVKNWKDFGINRISLGAQSFNNTTLKTIGRLHQKNDITTSFDQLIKNGINNINLDLIYGLPHESVSDFNYSLGEAIKLDPTHISLYQLAIEEKTVFHFMNQKGELPLPSEKETMQMYESALTALETAGFSQYELQNFSKPNYESVHNLRYWNLDEFLGFGLGAYSYIDGKRFGNTKKMRQYLDRINAKNFEAEIGEKITPEIKIKEKIILGLRLKNGIDINAFQNCDAGILKELIKQLNELTSEGLLQNQKTKYQLTIKGQHLSESVATRLV